MKFFKQSSLKTYFSVIMILTVVMTIVISNLASTFILSKNYEKEIERNHEQLGESIMMSVKEFINRSYSLTDQIANSPSIYSFDPLNQEEILQDAIKRNSNFELFFIQDVAGMQTARSSGSLGDRSSRWWFKKIIEEKQPFISKSYYSMTGNQAVSSAFIPIYNENNELKGIMGADIRLNLLQELVDTFSDETKYAYIIDGRGTLIAHLDTEKVAELSNYLTLERNVLSLDANGNVARDSDGNPIRIKEKFEISKGLKSIIEKVLKGEKGLLKYKNIEGEEIYSYYTPIELPGISQNWAVITVENNKDALAFTNGIKTFNYILSIVLLILVIILSNYFSGRITKPIHALIETIKCISHYDLSQNVSKKLINRKDEIGEIAREVQSIEINMRDVLGAVRDSAEEVSQLSNKFTMAAKQSASTANDVSNVVDQIAKGTTEQAENTMEGSEKLSQLGDIIKESRDHTLELQKSSLTVSNHVKEGLLSVEALMTKTQETSQSTESVHNSIIKTNESANKISDASSMIASIADQTNLLALNAAIEAARAGEHGRGFSVVAEEIKKLAEQSTASTKVIDQMVKTLRADAKMAVDNMSRASTVILEQQANVAITESKYREIELAMKKAQEAVEIIEKSSDAIELKKDIVQDALQNLSSVAEENAASTEETSAAMTEQTYLIEEMYKDSAQLINTVEQLQKLVEKFSL